MQKESKGIIQRNALLQIFISLFRTNPDGSSGDESAFVNVHFLDEKGDVTLLSSVVSCVFSKDETINHYENYCSGLCNKQIPGNYMNTYNLFNILLTILADN